MPVAFAAASVWQPAHAALAKTFAPAVGSPCSLNAGVIGFAAATGALPITVTGVGVTTPCEPQPARAAAAGHLDVVRRLADAGGDVTGHGDDHELEVIGWATCWDGCDDGAHRAVAEFLIGRGALHHIFSAIAMNLADEVRRIVAHDPAALNRRMSRNEDHQLPLHFSQAVTFGVHPHGTLHTCE